MHVDTGHNFQEALDFRDWMVKDIGAKLIVRYVQDSIDKGRAVEEKGPNPSRNGLQTITLLDALLEDCAVSTCCSTRPHRIRNRRSGVGGLARPALRT